MQLCNSLQIAWNIKSKVYLRSTFEILYCSMYAATEMFFSLLGSCKFIDFCALNPVFLCCSRLVSESRAYISGAPPPEAHSVQRAHKIIILPRD